MRLGCVISQNHEFNEAVRAICRFASPSQFSMHLAASLLEDRGYVRSLLEKSQTRLLRNRLLAESLLAEVGFDFHNDGYVPPH